MKRVFVGVVPSREAVVAIQRVQSDLWTVLEGLGVRASFPSSENLHLTLAFLGDRDDSAIAEIRKTLGGQTWSRRMIIEFSGVSAFWKRKSPRVIWLGVDKGSELIQELAEQVNRMLQPTEDRLRWTAHLTLARVRDAGRVSRSEFENIFDSVSPGESIASAIEEVILFESQLQGSKPPRYTALDHFGLR